MAPSNLKEVVSEDMIWEMRRLRQSLEEQRTQPGSRTTTHSIKDQKTLQARAVIGQLSHSVQAQINNLLANWGEEKKKENKKMHYWKLEFLCRIWRNCNKKHTSGNNFKKEKGTRCELSDVIKISNDHRHSITINITISKRLHHMKRSHQARNTRLIIMASSEIIGGIFLSGYKLFRVEKLAITTRPDFINDSRFKINKYSPGYVLS
ncbi:60S ribosomal protein L13a [Striga asiatica]|uniref:60S ribosomal protein L13a n=1 Tax=Striga asiatica TaxID=4170 RepID=A0A5A7R2Q4_STRAF|nr:60S ribosomal protein L13a [Striga asiatica]